MNDWLVDGWLVGLLVYWLRSNLIASYRDKYFMEKNKRETLKHIIKWQSIFNRLNVSPIFCTLKLLFVFYHTSRP